MDDLPLAQLRLNNLSGEQRKLKASIDDSGADRKLEGWAGVTKEWGV